MGHVTKHPAGFSISPVHDSSLWPIMPPQSQGSSKGNKPSLYRPLRHSYKMVHDLIQVNSSLLYIVGIIHLRHTHSLPSPSRSNWALSYKLPLANSPAISSTYNRKAARLFQRPLSIKRATLKLSNSTACCTADRRKLCNVSPSCRPACCM